jgi:hypothetical protein
LRKIVERKDYRPPVDLTVRGQTRPLGVVHFSTINQTRYQSITVNGSSPEANNNHGETNSTVRCNRSETVWKNLPLRSIAVVLSQLLFCLTKCVCSLSDTSFDFKKLREEVKKLNQIILYKSYVGSVENDADINNINLSSSRVYMMQVGLHESSAGDALTFRASRIM